MSLNKLWGNKMTVKDMLRQLRASSGKYTHLIFTSKDNSKKNKLPKFIIENNFNHKEFTQQNDEIVLCSNSKRLILDMVSFDYIYIPLTKEEAEKLKCNIIDPALRIKVCK